MASGFFPCRKLYTLSFLKIFTHKAVENYLFAYASVAFQDDFSVLPDCFRMSLARNKTSANRLDIIYDAGADLYNMRFYRKTFSKKTFECRITDIATHEGIYCDMLEDMFTMVTGLYTHF